VSIGDKIRALRKERNLTQDAIAEALNVTRQAVAKWESNQAAPSTANILKLAELFQVQFQDLLSQEENVNTDIQKYLIKTAQAEERRKKKHAIIKKSVLVSLRIGVCYLLLYFICWVIFHLLGIPDYVWSWSIDHYILPLSLLYSLAGSLFYRERLGYFTLFGTAAGLVLGNIVDSITTKNAVLSFNTGWIALMLCIGAFSLCGIAVSVIRSKKSTKGSSMIFTQKGQRIALGVLSFCLALFVILSFGTSVRQIAFNRGAVAGYSAGYEQGLADKENGLPANSDISNRQIPERYRYGTSAYKGYMVYWPTGYQDGYEEWR